MPSHSCSREQAVTALRILALDAVQKANSGHPGMVLGMADLAERLFTRHLRHNPADPNWPDRDRFVLSNGHGSMLIYGLLHLTGYDLGLDDLAAFRQFDSRTPGHPEYGMTPGVETTTGPLGQGLATAVGMALAERQLAARFNRPQGKLVDHRTWVFVGDGCLMEGVSQEAISLAGVQKLGKLIVLWDDNGISIDGPVEGWFAEDVRQRFGAAGWNTLGPLDGHDPDAIDAALERAKADSSAPWLIQCRTRIGYQVPDIEGTSAAHSGAIGDDKLAQMRQLWDWPHAPFEIPAAVSDYWNMGGQGEQWQAEWRQQRQAYEDAHPREAREFGRLCEGRLPDLGAAFEQLFEDTAKASMATRKALQVALEAIAPEMPELTGSSADLAGSNGVLWSGTRAMAAAQPDGNYLYAGVREFGMSAAMNGMMLHGGVRPFGGTFLTFSDYARPAVRLAALMRQPVIFVYSHDSVALGEDGPTHQPIEHLAALRAIPNLEVWRPGSALETSVAWQQILALDSKPAALVLTRQNLLALPPAAGASMAQTPERIAGGAYEVHIAGAGKPPNLVLLASGSEVGICVEAAVQLQGEGRNVRVFSVPCMSRFAASPELQQALPEGVPRLAVEAGTGGDWWRWLTPGRDELMGIEQFGISGPGDEVMAHFGFDAEGVVKRARRLLPI